MKKLFGTDGIRGEAGKFPLDRETVKIIGRSLAEHFGREDGHTARLITGRDTRKSGTWIEDAFTTGAHSGGAVCESAGVITTPGVAYLTKAEGFDAGIVISASHNPFQDNGVKVFLPSGKKLDSSVERSIEKHIAEKDLDFDLDETSDQSSAEGYQKTYIEHLEENFTNLSLEGLKISVDCANGAASSLAPKLFADFGAEVKPIYNSPDGENINRDCGSLHLEKLQEAVIVEGADFGVAFDGDADRSLFVDEKGDLVDGDATLWIMAQHLKAKGGLYGETVVATVMSNIGLELALDSIGVKLLRTSVGDKYVLEELLKTRAAVGGEQSGHIIFPNHSLVGDGMQTALFLLEALKEGGRTLSEAKKGFTQFPQILVNVRVNEKRPFDEVSEIMEGARKIEEELGDTGRLLLRYSGTENLARVMIEGKDQSEIEEQANSLANVIQGSLG